MTTMRVSTNILDLCRYDLSSETAWIELYPLLRTFVKQLVYGFAVPSWRGQEDDIVEDIVQETARRLLERVRKAERGEAAPIHALEPMMRVIAYNYCTGMWRHDRWLVRLIPDDYSLGVHFITYDQLNLAEVATENMYRESLFSLLAHEIADFPYKQRRALLIDLANRMRFETQPTALQEAFLEVGIQLQDYQQPLPTNPVERRQHTSLLNHAYKRIAALACMQEYVSAA